MFVQESERILLNMCRTYPSGRLPLVQYHGDCRGCPPPDGRNIPGLHLDGDCALWYVLRTLLVDYG